MIVFNNWQITHTGDILARQYDNLSRTLLVNGVPEGYDWKMMVRVDEHFDIIDLPPMKDGVGVVLTEDQLSVSGYYKLQLVGTLQADGVTTRHTNVLTVYVGPSMSGDAQWPTVPSEFSQMEARLRELNNHPPVPGENGCWMLWDADAGQYVDSEFPLPEGGSGGTLDHSKLQNRGADDQHPMSAITGLEKALESKQPAGAYLTEETDPTVPDWAKAPEKPVYTAKEVGADPAGTAASRVAAHNTGADAHSDIRVLIQGLTDRLNALADSDDTTLDQLSEVVAYIKSNRTLIEAITTNKVSVSDIVDNLTTNVANKPLSAAQGVALKSLIDALTEAMPEAYTLPIASPTVLGGVQPVAKTDAMTQSVGVDEAGALWAPPGSGGSGSTLLRETAAELTEDVGLWYIPFDFTGVNRIVITAYLNGSASPKIKMACGGYVDNGSATVYNAINWVYLVRFENYGYTTSLVTNPTIFSGYITRSNNNSAVGAGTFICRYVTTDPDGLYLSGTLVSGNKINIKGYAS